MSNSTQPITETIARLIHEVGEPVLITVPTSTSWKTREYDPNTWLNRTMQQNHPLRSLLSGARIGRETVTTLREVVA